MNKNDFIKNVIQRHNLSEKDVELLTADYSTVLEENTDFDDLFKVYLEEYSYNVAPKPAWFTARAKKKKTFQAGNYEIRDLLVVLDSGLPYQFSYEYPNETEQQAIEDIVRRFKGKKYKLYRIAKIDEGEDGIRREKQEIYI